jgi:hypothetical protein
MDSVVNVFRALRGRGSRCGDPVENLHSAVMAKVNARKNGNEYSPCGVAVPR